MRPTLPVGPNKEPMRVQLSIYPSGAGGLDASGEEPGFRAWTPRRHRRMVTKESSHA